MNMDPVTLPASGAIQTQATPIIKSRDGAEARDISASVLAPVVSDADSAGAVGKPTIDRKQVEEAAEKVQQFVSIQASNLRFTVDDESGRTVVKVIDASTDETIRQIPSEEVLAIAKALDRLQGLLIRQTA